MHKSIKSLIFILVLFLSVFVSPITALAQVLDQIIIANEVEALKSVSGKKQLRIVDHNGLIFVPKVKAIKPAVKDLPKPALAIEKKPEPKPNSNNTDKEEVTKTEVKADQAPKVENPEPVKTETKITAKPDPNQTTIVTDPKIEPVKPSEPKNEVENIVKPVKTVDEIKDLIQKTAIKYEVDPDLMLRLAKCESNFRADVVTINRYYGIFQFSMPTFIEFSKKMKMDNADPLNAEQNIEVAAYMIQNGQLSRWGCKV